MNTILSRLFPGCFTVLCLILMSSGCLKSSSSPTVKLYFEPPETLITDYTAMVEVEELNWAWTALGFRFSNYRSVTVNSVASLVAVTDKSVDEKLYRGLISWFEEAGIQLSDGGDLLCELAVVDLNLERSFLKKVNPFNEDNNDLVLEIELLITVRATGESVCKIRHGALGSTPDMLLKRVLGGLYSYFDLQT